jgi:uncharacterized protein (TIGR02452 family)
MIFLYYYPSTMTDLVAIWHDTIRYFELKQTQVPDSEKIDINGLTDPDFIGTYNPTIDIVNQDTFEMAIDYRAMGLNPLVLNMASAAGPGGGVARGARAQEEDLFRRSNAHLTHPRSCYPLKPTEMIYSPEVTIVKDPNYKKIREVKVSLLAIAAIRKPILRDGRYSESDYNLMCNKIEAIFQVGIIKGHDSLVLGALGCGAFDNPPQIVASIFKEMLIKYRQYFKRIGFAILVVKSKDKDNLVAFQTKIL